MDLAARSITTAPSHADPSRSDWAACDLAIDAAERVATDRSNPATARSGKAHQIRSSACLIGSVADRAGGVMETEESTDASSLGGNSIRVGHSFRRIVALR